MKFTYSVVLCSFYFLIIMGCTQAKKEKNQNFESTKIPNSNLDNSKNEDETINDYKNEEEDQNEYNLDSLILKIFNKDLAERIHCQDYSTLKIEKYYRIVSFKYSNLSCPKICPEYQKILTLDTSNSIIGIITVYNFSDVTMHPQFVENGLSIDSINYSVEEAGEDINQIPLDTFRIYYNIDSLGRFAKSYPK